MTRPADFNAPAARAPALVLANGLGLGALVCLALVTLADRGATRMHAWPWSMALSAAQFLPLAALALRAFSNQPPLQLPSRRWQIATALAAASAIGSALASPFRGPSVLGAATPLGALAAFYLLHDVFARRAENGGALFARIGAWCAGVIACVSVIGWWAQDVLPSGAWRSLGTLLQHRNANPLGHSTYTAGLAVLLLPWPLFAAWRARGVPRIMWSSAALLVLVMLFTSGSRGGLIGLAALATAAILLARLGWKRVTSIGGLALVAVLALALANPRVRAIFQPANPADPVSLSNQQRAAMFAGGLRMGADRPLLGWGPETTPLVFPRYRAALDGGVENYLQLHSLPVQLWADHGALGLAAALFIAVLAFGAATRAPLAATALAGYVAFAFTDAQLDVPVFAFSIATLLAQLAAHSPSAALARTDDRVVRTALGATAFAALIGIAILGRRDPTPEMNVRALALARDPSTAPKAIALLRDSLALNPDQEIAHFNLGWLLVVRDPPAAEKHFLAAARLVPDKGGVYFGLGLARLNQNSRTGAARAFALECLNDPAFLGSPWWREPGIAPTRDAAREEFTRLAAAALPRLPAGSPLVAELRRVAALAPRLGEVPSGPARMFTRERTGYPVLMRNLDLPPPSDLFLVRESTSPVAEALPAKGWLPSPLLLELLDASAGEKPKSKI